MKESPSSNYPNLIFREVFRSEQETRKNGGTPTDVDFANGKGTFNGTSSKVNYNLGLNGTYSVRVRCNPTSFAATRYLFDCRGSNDDGAGRIRLASPSGAVTITSGTSYVNGLATTATIVGVDNEVIITGITLTQGTGANLSLIGSEKGNVSEFLGTMDLVEIYSGTLTASEVSNLYNDRWNTELPPTTPREVTQFSCDTTVSSWQRCADDSGTNKGGTYGVGKSLKAVGVGSGVGAGNDLVGFAATLPGYRSTSASFGNIGSYLNLWSSTPSSATGAWRRTLNTSYSTVNRDANNKAYGFSVRCLRDTDDTSDFTDPRDGTVYQCVRIGTQVWMTKNLAYLPSVNEVADNSTDDPMYYVYGYDGTDVATAKALSNYTEYGVLYNHPAAIISAPTGFHVPSDEELNVLELATLEVIAETAGDDLMTILNDGNVGIGTTSPTEKLDVVGKISLNDGGNSVFVGEGAGLNDDGTDNRNVGIGYQSLYYNTTGQRNTANGYQSLFSNTTGQRNIANGYASLYYNTTGQRNTANGMYSLYSNTTGSYNTANGMYSLYSNTTGSYNTANGYQSLYYNTTGSQNTANGMYSLFSNTTGSQNTANGYQAGRYIADGTTANETGTYNTFIGSNTKALADGDTNEIVIGNSATGIGSNSVVLGNDDITKTVLKGNVGIGTTSPSEKLDVNGKIKATQYKLSDLNTAPSSSSDTGTKGEIRVTADAIYICSATDTWVKTDLATF